MGVKHSTISRAPKKKKESQLFPKHAPPPYSYPSTTAGKEAVSRALHGPLTEDTVDTFRHLFREDSKNMLALSAITRADPTSVIMNRGAAVADEHTFNVKLEVEGKATNQKSSGRCWIFAGTNVLRLKVINKYKLEDFELSQSYLFFWDKLEKANFFLENMIDLADREIDDRVVQYLLSSPVNDGGQWDMFVNLVNKYGLVPKSVYPESYSSSSSSRLNWIVTVKLREFATRIRSDYAAGVRGRNLRSQKDSMMTEIYRIIVISLGEPPEKFDWITRNKNGKCVEAKDMRPKSFAEEVVGYPITETFSLINDPRNAYNRLYTVDRLGNVVGGNPVRYVNTDIATIKQLVVAVLKSGRSVWFGADVGKFSNQPLGILDTKLYDYNLGFNITLGMNKAERLLYGESLMTHAMVFSGVHLNMNKPVRWRVENSWGEDSGEKGYWVMSDDWFSEYVYQVVLEKRDAPKRLVEVLEQDPVVLPAYDPMGSLA